MASIAHNAVIRMGLRRLVRMGLRDTDPEENQAMSGFVLQAFDEAVALADEIKELSNESLMVQELNTSCTQSDASLKELSTAIVTLTDADAFTREVNDLKTQLADKDKELRELQAQLTAKGNDIQESHMRLESAQTQFADRETRIQKLEANLAEREGQLTARLADKERELQELQTKFADQENRNLQDAKAHEEMLGESREECESLRDMLSLMKEKQLALQASVKVLEEKEKQVLALTKETGQKDEHIRNLTAEIGKKGAQFAALNDILGGLRGQLRERGIAIAQLTYKLDGMTDNKDTAALKKRILHAIHRKVENIVREEQETNEHNEHQDTKVLIMLVPSADIPDAAPLLYSHNMTGLAADALTDCISFWSKSLARSQVTKSEDATAKIFAPFVEKETRDATNNTGQKRKLTNTSDNNSPQHSYKKRSSQSVPLTTDSDVHRVSTKDASETSTTSRNASSSAIPWSSALTDVEHQDAIHKLSKKRNLDTGLTSSIDGSIIIDDMEDEPTTLHGSTIADEYPSIPEAGRLLLSLNFGKSFLEPKENPRSGMNQTPSSSQQPPVDHRQVSAPPTSPIPGYVRKYTKGSKQEWMDILDGHLSGLLAQAVGKKNPIKTYKLEAMKTWSRNRRYSLNAGIKLLTDWYGEDAAEPCQWCKKLDTWCRVPTMRRIGGSSCAKCRSSGQKCSFNAGDNADS